MANTARRGFFPARVHGGGGVTLQRRRVVSGNSAAIFTGDAVVTDSASDILVATSTTTAIASVARGFSYVDSSLGRVTRHYLPASTTYSGSTVDPVNASYAFIVDDALNVDFECSGTTAITLTNLNNNTAMVLTAGSTTTGYSAHTLDTASPATTATLPWRIKNFLFDGVNDPDAATAALIATINAGMLEPALTASTGV